MSKIFKETDLCSYFVEVLASSLREYRVKDFTLRKGHQISGCFITGVATMSRFLLNVTLSVWEWAFLSLFFIYTYMISKRHYCVDADKVLVS